MKVYSFYIKALLVCHAIILASCTDYVVKDPNFMPPDVVITDDTGNNDIIEGLPTPGEMQPYSPSLLGKPYRPIKVKYSNEFPPVTKWTESNTVLSHTWENTNLPLNLKVTTKPLQISMAVSFQEPNNRPQGVFM